MIRRTCIESRSILPLALLMFWGIVTASESIRITGYSSGIQHTIANVHAPDNDRECDQW